MALVVKDRVQETTITVGTIAIVLAGAVSGFQSFSVIGNGNTTYYAIVGSTEWEVGIGTYTLLGTTLSRDTILESSNGGTAVNFSVGTKNVFVTYAAEKGLYLDASGNAIALGTPASVTLTNGTGLPLTTGVTGTLPIANGGTGTTSTTFTNLTTNVTGTLPVANGGTGITSLGTGVATFLGTPTSANLAAALTDETGTGANVFGTSPTIASPTFTSQATFAAGTAALPAITTTGDTDTGIWFPAANTVAASTSGTERMRILSGGEVLIGATASLDAKLAVAGTAASANVGLFQARSTAASDSASCAAAFVKTANDSTTSQVFIRFGVNAYAAGCGQINANGANAAAFGSFSDIRLKENIENLPPQLANIIALRPVEFDFKTGGHQIGFIAQEMQEVYSDAVGEGADGMLTITGWSKTEARLVKAIQEQQALITSLTARITALEGA